MSPLSERDRRALKALGVAGGIFVVVVSGMWLWPDSSGAGDVTGPTAPQAEKQLTRLRRLAGAVPAREEIDRRFSAELAGREKGLIDAETPAQAQAQLLQIVRRVAQLQTPAMPIGGSDFSAVRPLAGPTARWLSPLPQTAVLNKSSTSWPTCRASLSCWRSPACRLAPRTRKRRLCLCASPSAG